MPQSQMVQAQDAGATKILKTSDYQPDVQKQAKQGRKEQEKELKKNKGGKPDKGPDKQKKQPPQQAAPQPAPQAQDIQYQAGWQPSPMVTLTLGAGLIIANVLSQSSIPTLVGALFNKPTNNKQATNVLSNIWTIAGEAVFVLVLSFLTGLSPLVGKAITYFMLALWAVWLLTNWTKVLAFFGKGGGSNNITAKPKTGSNNQTVTSSGSPFDQQIFAILAKGGTV